MTTKPWKCLYCDSTTPQSARSSICASSECTAQHMANRSKKRKVMTSKYEQTPERKAAKKKANYKRQGSYYKDYATREEVRERKRLRKQSFKIAALWDADKGCPMTGKHIGLSFVQARAHLEFDHILPISLLQKAGLAEHSNNLINLWWVDATANKEKNGLPYHHYVRNKGGSDEEIDAAMLKVASILSAFVDESGFSDDAINHAFAVFEVDRYHI